MESDWLAELYRDYRCQFLLAARTILRDQEAAEDAVHSAFVRLIRLGHRPSDPKLYAFKSVRNAALDLLAKRQRQRECPLERAAEPVIVSPETQETSLLTTVARAVGELEQESREVVELHLRVGLTFQEIADMLGQPLSTVSIALPSCAGKTPPTTGGAQWMNSNGTLRAWRNRSPARRSIRESRHS